MMNLQDSEVFVDSIISNITDSKNEEYSKPTFNNIEQPNENNFEKKLFKNQNIPSSENDLLDYNCVKTKNSLSFLFTSEKAGMQGLDRDKINQIILESTKDSMITKNKNEQYEKVKKSVEDYKHRLRSLYKNRNIYEQNKILVDKKLKEIEMKRNTTRIWLHIDMDMFYAAIEIRDNPTLKDLPIAVGDLGMISTSNYVARKYGVRSGMPGFLGKKLCPQLVFVPVNYEKYKKESIKIMTILKDYDMNIESRGLDEAFLDMTNFCKDNYITLQYELEELIKEIKLKIFDETKLTCSIGISTNKMLAKICSDKNKPNGITLLLTKNPDEIINFLSDLNIRKIPFVGEKMEQKLNLLEVKNCKDLINHCVDLFYVLNDNMFDFLMTSALGIGDYFHEEIKGTVNKSVSCSETFRMTDDMGFIKNIFEKLVKKLYSIMLSEEIVGKNLSIEIKDKNDKLISKTFSLKKFYETENELKNNGWNLLISLMNNSNLRLIRIKLSSLRHTNQENLRKKNDNPIMKWVEKLTINKPYLNNISNDSKEKTSKTISLQEKSSISKRNPKFAKDKNIKELFEKAISSNMNSKIQIYNNNKNNFGKFKIFENSQEKNKEKLNLRELSENQIKTPLKKKKAVRSNSKNNLSNFLDINLMLLKMKNEKENSKKKMNENFFKEVHEKKDEILNYSKTNIQNKGYKCEDGEFQKYKQFDEFKLEKKKIPKEFNSSALKNKKNFRNNENNQIRIDEFLKKI